MAHPFVAMQPEYLSSLSRMVVTRASEVDRTSDKLLVFVHQGRYAEVSAHLEIPQLFIATSFERESGSNFACSPAQGDPWDRVSTHVPRNLGPYTGWTPAAIAAFKIDRLDQVGAANWTWARFPYEGEAFNGFGPRNRGRQTGYDWAGSSVYTGGKYVADGVWDANSVDSQLGIVPVARAMALKMPELDLPGWPGVATPPVGVSVPGPVPPEFGGSLPGGPLTGTKWLQDSLNKLMSPGSDHLVVDGNFGRFTRMAMRAFQKSIGHTADGLVDDLTLSLMDQYLAKL